MKSLRVEIARNDRIAENSCLIRLEAPEIASTAKPGQFLMVRCGDGGRTILRRPLSVHGIDRQGGVALLFDVKGKGTAWLAEQKAGESLDVLGPLGNGFTIKDGSANLLMAAGGMGIAPLAFLAQSALDRNKRVTFLLGLRDSRNLSFRERVPGGAGLTVVTEDGSFGVRGRVADLIPQHAERADEVFACGPLAMYRCLSDDFGRYLKGKPVSVSVEERMACGFGVCLGCTVATKHGQKQVCQDGPVFELSELLW